MKKGRTPRAGGGLHVLNRVKAVFDSLSPSEKKVAKFLLSHADRMIYMSISECAENCKVSETTVIRFAHMLDLTGYQHLKIELAKNVVDPTSALAAEVTPSDSQSDALQKVFRAATQSLESTFSILDPDRLNQALDAIVEANHILAVGFGTSNLACQYMEYKFLRIGIKILAHQDFHLLMTSTALLEPADVVFCFSHSGETRQVIELVEEVAEKGVTTISVTNHKRSPLVKASNITLLTSAFDPPTGTGTSASLISQLIMVDALTIGLALRDKDHSLSFMAKTVESVKSQKL